MNILFGVLTLYYTTKIIGKYMYIQNNMLFNNIYIFNNKFKITY